jgi:hypothetical protein
VSYYYDGTNLFEYIIFWIHCLFALICADDIGNYYYGQAHPMKPHRIRMAHSLIVEYGLYKRMEIYVCISLVFNLIRKYTLIRVG